MTIARELPLLESATWWSVPAGEIERALASRPLVVLLHGWGADERDLAGLVPALPDGAVYASLRAPLPLPGRGFGWFPLSLTTAELGVPDPGLADAAARGVLTWLDRTRARARTHGPVALLGFSQGAATALQVLRHAPELVDGAVLLSGFVVPGLVAGDEALAQIRPPVLSGHDPADPVIPAAATERLQSFLTEHTAVDLRTYPGAGHGITTAEAADVGAFLARVLSPSA